MAIPAEKGTVLALLDAKGKVRSGWPVLLKGASDCEVDAHPADGSVRAVCAVATSVRAYALDVVGRLMAGWPVDLHGGSMQSWRSDAAAVVDGGLSILVLSSGEGGQSARVTRISPDGSTLMGTWVRGVGHMGCCSVVGPDGTAYVQGDGELWAIDLDGVHPGFPVTIDG